VGAGHPAVELAYGFTPFRGARRDETFDNILKQPLRFPAKPLVSPECQDLIAQLLTKDPAKRLGTRLGAEEIKAHALFADVNWALLRNETPPFIPRRAAPGAGGGASGGGGGGQQFDNF